MKKEFSPACSLKEAARTRERQAAAASQNEAEESDATEEEASDKQERERREWDDDREGTKVAERESARDCEER